MNEIMFFDTETTGIPDWRLPSDDPVQPHLVRLAAVVADAESRTITQQLDCVVRPDGWQIPQETIDIHGITMEKAQADGMPESLALQNFLALWNDKHRVAHNTTFDNRIIRIATKRYSDQDTINAWHKGAYTCTGIMARKAMGLNKMPKLTEAYAHFMRRELDNAHDAMADAVACMNIYFAMQDIEARA